MTWRLAVCFAALCHPCAAQDNVSTRVFDVRVFESSGLLNRAGVYLALPLSTTFLDAFEPEYHDVLLEQRSRIGGRGWDWDDALFDCVGESWNDAQLVDREGWLEIMAPVSVLAESAAVLAELEALALRSVEIELFVLSPASVAAIASPVLDASQARTLLSSAELLGHDRVVARVGQRALLGPIAREAFVMDYDVEVSQFQGVADPQVSVLHDGTEVGTIVDELPDGRLLARVWGRSSERLPGTQIILPSLDAAPITLPRSASALHVGSAILEDGGALLMGQTWNGTGLWLLRFRRAPGTLAGESLPVGLLLATPLTSWAPWLQGPSPSGGYLGPDADEPPSSGRYDELDIVELLQPKTELEQTDRRALVVGGQLHLRGDSEYRAAARRRIEALTGRLDDVFDVELRFDVADVGRGRAVSIGETTPDELAGELTHRALGACRAGDVITIVGGEECLYLQDYDMEIGGGDRATDDPVIANLFEGFSLACRPLFINGGAIDVDLQLDLQVPVRDIVESEVVFWRSHWPQKDVRLPRGMVQLPATTHGGGRSRELVRPGEWHLVANESLEGLDRCLLAVLRVRPVEND